MSALNDTKLAKIALAIILLCIVIVMAAIVYIVIPVQKPVKVKEPTPAHGKPTPNATRMATTKPAPSIPRKPTSKPTLRPVPTREWYKYRQDNAMTGHSDGAAKMINPPVPDWSYDIANWQGYLTIHPALGQRDIVKLPYHTPVAPNFLKTNLSKWNLGPPRYDLFGNGKLIPVGDDPARKVAPLLTDRPGLQKVVVDSYYQAENNARARLYAYNNGYEQLIWTSEPFSNCYGPVVCIIDANNDGQLDVVIAMHYRLVVLHGATGATLMDLTYTKHRNYGYLGAATIPGDPYPKFCVISDFSQHIEVFDNNGTSLSLKWSLQVEESIYQNSCITQPGPDSFGDMDHDGRLEVVCNIFNYHGRNCWDILIFDAENGKVKYELNNCYLNGLVDLDNDGSIEVLTTTTTGQVIPTYGELSIYQLIPNQSPARLWTYPKARFHTKDLDAMPLTANTMAANGRCDLVYGPVHSRRQNDIFISVPGNGNREICQCLGFDEQHRLRNWFTINGRVNSKLDVLAVDANDSGSGLLISLTTRGVSGEALTVVNGTGELKQWTRQTPLFAGPPVVADLEGDGWAEIIAGTQNGEVFCFERNESSSKRKFKIRWRMKGQGMTKDAVKQDGLLVADLDQDGLKEVIFAREAASGQASIVVVRPDGSLKWRHVFPDFDGSAPIWNLGGITYWIAGNFTNRRHCDLYVSIRRSKMHSDVGFLLDGRNGRLNWERNGILLSGGNPVLDIRGHGGDRMAAADMDNDGLEELVGAYPDRVYIIDGLSGNPKVVKSTASSLFPGIWVAYAAPVLVNLSGGPALEIFYGRSGYLTALLDNRANLLWQGEATVTGNNGCNYLQGIGDTDGDRRLEIGGIYRSAITNEYEFRIYKETSSPLPKPSLNAKPEPVSQSSLWEISRQFSLKDLGRPCTDTVTADLDGDGRDEFLFGIGNSLQCLGNKGFKWALNLKAVPGEIALADTDRDGRLEIVIVTNDGYVRVYK